MFLLIALPGLSLRPGLLVGVATAFLLLAAAPAFAQRADSARAGAPAPVNPRQPADSLLRPPISPRRAFVSSFLFPGAGQAVLRRPVAGSIYASAELLSLFMIAKSREDLRLAEAVPHSIVVGFDLGNRPAPILEAHPLPPRIRARRQHLEDWYAILIFNHFFSAADAFVAAHLWEVPARVSVVPHREGIAFAMSVAW